MLLAQCNQRPRIFEQGRIGRVPIEPRKLVILTVGIVIAMLGASDLVAGQNHWHALGKEQAHQQVANLSGSECDDLRIVTRSFDTAIPGTIVTLAVAIVLT